jgi:hypothetical protein
MRILILLIYKIYKLKLFDLFLINIYFEDYLFLKFFLIN